MIVATGARARDLPFAPTDGKRIWTYRHAMTPPEMPSKLLVIGSGAIGIEFASFYNDMGAEVTVVEMLDRIVPVEDADVSAFLEKSLTKQGMTILTGAGVEELKVGPNGVSAKIKGKDGKVDDGRVQPRRSSPSASSPTPRTSGSRKSAPSSTAASSRSIPTAAPAPKGLWAIGDCTPGPWLAHKASHEGVTAAEAIAQELGNKDVHPHPLDRNAIPGCTYCHPQIASVGLTEAKAKEAGLRGQGRHLPVHRQRQGDRARRARGLHQDGVRRQDRRAAGRAHGRRRSDRADPGLHRRQGARDHRGRADGHGVPAPDADAR